MSIAETLGALAAADNLRRIPADRRRSAALDLSGNDYLGLAVRNDLRREFMEEAVRNGYAMTASASRLLGGLQDEFNALEQSVATAYGRPALLFNSGYHANTGMIAALSSDRHTLVVADRLVHASIIDGIRLGGASMERFRHNDYDHLRRILRSKAGAYSRTLIIAESIYSMDGDRADIAALVDAKESVPGAILYIDEAHAVGACGPRGLGLVEEAGLGNRVDIVLGTMGKALASTGAYAVLSDELRSFMVNKARSLIFSTAMPPICAAWGRFVFERMQLMDDERRHLAQLSQDLYSALGIGGTPCHIAPLLAGSSARALEMSAALENLGYHVLPIRTPTVPPGTERLRFSISAAMSREQIRGLASAVASL